MTITSDGSYININCQVWCMQDALPKAYLEWPDLKSICTNLVTSSGKESVLGTSSEEHEEVIIFAFH